MYCAVSCMYNRIMYIRVYNIYIDGVAKWLPEALCSATHFKQVDYKVDKLEIHHL